jgi:hypothetical protein
MDLSRIETKTLNKDPYLKVGPDFLGWNALKILVTSERVLVYRKDDPPLINLSLIIVLASSSAA